MIRATLAATAAALTLIAAAGADNYGGVSRAEQKRVTRLVYQTFGSGWVGQCFVRIVRRESGFNRWAVNWNDRHANGRGSFGLLQIGRIHVGRVGGDYRRLYDPLTNLRVGRALYRSSGFRPWGGCP